MTEDTINTVTDMVTDGEASDEAPAKPAANGDDTDKSADDTARTEKRSRALSKVRWRRPRTPWLWVSAVLAAAMIGGGVFGFFKYQGVADDLAAMRRAEADRNAAAQVAKDYAKKSLTYTFDDPDAFFRSVQGGVSQPLKDKYTNAADLLKGVMLQAQVTSSGEVLAAESVAQPGGMYQVVVTAAQTTRNLQHPEPKVSLIALQITVNKVGDTWQVSDIGPKTGSHPPNTDQIPQPAPAPAPGQPSPPGR
ncbi:hypothetical protein [Mycobacterium celatum]|uniref:Mce-associated membrane protein n=1 Tax=Mycobacterium celatum TaxID=28045 RepID=A0A1X1RMU9_MYCCE|nr:hypothetical protein [Mycobacterium celatum]ORV09934.1 hypothetical protein AWB95_17095 [Mycobacterium celatum]PIB79748.1 hypothetical protein CQY23_07515 [Mycobacterium celatum]